MMAAKRDYYETLGIDKKSDKAAIKRAYRKLAKKYHPDTNAGDAHAEEMFKDVTEAYNVLSDEKKRKLYDEFGFAGLQEGFSEEAARQASHGGFGGFGGFGGNGPLVVLTAQMGNHSHIRSFILRTVQQIWMIFSQCSEICSRMVEIVMEAGVHHKTVDLRETAVTGAALQVVDTQQDTRVQM